MQILELGKERTDVEPASSAYVCQIDTVAAVDDKADLTL
jgi:hypothetical protein